MNESSPALLVFRHLFASVTDEMGAALQQSAVSPNIKERLDYSCALLDGQGRLVAHAAFIPVHLGSAHHTVPAVLEELDPDPGDVVVLNDPRRGGTHLNDVTVLMPLYAGSQRIGFLLNRAHHADIGGAEPGSMGGAQDILGEGLCLPPMRLLQNGVETSVWQLLAGNVRDPQSTRADLQAQCAALFRGADRFHQLLQRYGSSALTQAMADLYTYGANYCRSLLRSWPRHGVQVEDYLDGPGTPKLCLQMQVKRGRLSLDFSGTSSQVQGSWNTHRAVTTSAVFYLLQALGKGLLPETSGTLESVDLRLPKGSLVSSDFPAGVALGNVETSQRLVDLVLRALAKMFPGQFPAASQGTMNNLLFGGHHADGRPFVHYETMAGGAGAGPQRAGASAVQTHMTNTRNTPVEVMETELPVRVRVLALRRRSGGAGLHRGGDGLVKEIEFLQPTRLMVAATRRRSQAAGIEGGKDGAAGKDAWAPAGKGFRPLPVLQSMDLQPGDRVRIATPGGGGWKKGKHKKRSGS